MPVNAGRRAPLKGTNRFARAHGHVLSRQRMADWRSTARIVLVCIGCLLAWCLAAASSVRAADYRLGVLQVESDDVNSDALAPVFMEELRAILAARPGIAPVDTRVTLTQLSIGQDCSTGESSCLLRIANSLRVDGLLFGKLTHEGGEPVAILRRYDVASASIDASALVTFDSQEATAAAVHDETQKLVSALLGEAPAVAEAPATEAPPEAAAPAAATAAPPEGSGISGRKIAGFSLLGAAVVSAGLTVLSFVEIDQSVHDPSFEKYRLAVGQNDVRATDVCDEASTGKRYGLSDANFREVRSACNTGQTFEVLQYVFLGTAVVTGGLATFLLLGGSDDAEDKPQAITLVPSVGLRQVALHASLHF